jgi:hypothetical protein
MPIKLKDPLKGLPVSLQMLIVVGVLALVVALLDAVFGL